MEPAAWSVLGLRVYDGAPIPWGFEQGCMREAESRGDGVWGGTESFGKLTE